MLRGEDLGRRHHRRLTAVFDGEVNRGGGHGRLAAADVALHEPHHRLSARHIAEDFPNRPLLRAGEAEGQRAEKGGRARPLELLG